MKSAILILIMLVPIGLYAGGSGSMCTIPGAGICFSYGADISIENGRSMCGMPGAEFQTTGCPNSEVVGHCLNRTPSGTIETFFYYPRWTLNLVQDRCAKSGGQFSR